MTLNEEFPMPIQATCPGCRATLQVGDAARGKQVRCGSCKTVFVAGATAVNGNNPSPKPASSAVKPAASAVNPAAKPKNVASNVPRPKTAPPVLLEEDDDRPKEKKKKKSILPACLIGCGALFLLCGGGGSIGGYFAYQKFVQLKADATESLDQFQAEIDKAAAEQKRKQEEDQKRLKDQFKPKPPDNNWPPDRKPKVVLNPPVQPPDQPKPPVPPPDKPNPPQPRPKSEIVQSVALNIPLAAKPFDVQGVQWTGMDGKQAVSVIRANKSLRLDQYDLTNGRKLGRMLIPQDAFTSIRDFTPDGNYYLCNQAGTAFSIWAMPNPKPIVSRWLPPPVKNEPSGVSSTVVAAYLLNGPRVLTVNGAGQVAVWSIPKVADEKPAQELSFIPPRSVARYPAGLGYGYTALNSDRTRLAVFDGKDGFFMLNTTTLQLEGSVKSPEDGKEIANAINGMLGVAFNPDGKHLAAVFHQQLIGRASKGRKPSYPQIVRWDVQTRQRTARFADPSKGAGGAGSRVGWWGNDFFWVAYINRSGTLISWDKQSVVLYARLLRSEKVLFGNSDGKCWFIGTGPDGGAVLKGIDLPAAALLQGDQPMRLTTDGIVRR